MPNHPAFEGLNIEISATDIIGNLELVTVLAKRSRYHNIAISIDNLRTEWPSLQLVELKADAQFVAGCVDNRLQQTTCRRIVELAGAVGARTVADGVGTRADSLARRRGLCLGSPVRADRAAASCRGRVK
jgi:EAL domain-containing protein (putative c-di-GMP-specific phosphodiesterase class I)